MRKANLLVILDGFGYREEVENNAIALANTPTWDQLWQSHPHTLISGSGEDVGLPAGQMGNSEVGHMNMGAGRVVHQDLTRIDRAISQGEFGNNRAFNHAIKKLDANRALHILGLLSPGGVHSHEEQIFAMIRLAAEKGVENIYLHAFLDGRDTPPQSARASIQAAEDLFVQLGHGQLASICGRYYAMDRDNNWDRLEPAYNLLVRGEAPFHAATGVAGLQNAYARDENDEFVKPTAVHGKDQLPVTMQDGDALVFMNFRSDRARQMTRALTLADFDGFERRSVASFCETVTLTHYADDIHVPCAFEQQKLNNTLGEYLANLGKKQLRVAETEKYAHVTFFFSGGVEQPQQGEERILIPSPKVATYDLQPEMSALEITEQLTDAICSGQYDLIVCNYANGDMVGHTGQLKPATQAVEVLDACLAKLTVAINETGGQMLITADHGNCEMMRDANTDQAHTAHTHNMVPLVYVGDQVVRFLDQGTLADVAPTLLALMHLEIPAEMTGKSLVSIEARQTA